jgi:hypothetical protein
LTNFEGQVLEYLPDKTWVKLALFNAQGICLMAHIKDHPNWQVCSTLDGFSSHLVPAGLAPFTAANITVIKEEGDTIQVNQAYDQSVDKKTRRSSESCLIFFDPTKSLQSLSKRLLLQYVLMHLEK